MADVQGEAAAHGKLSAADLQVGCCVAACSQTALHTSYGQGSTSTVQGEVQLFV